MTDPNSILEKIIEEPWKGDILDVPTAWAGCENYIIPLIKRFNIKTNKVLEFGVDSGYSLYILSQIFEKAKGVDSFTGDIHIGHEQGDEFYNNVKQRLNYKNIELVRSDFREFIKKDEEIYDLIHIDIVHTYRETFECAQWSLEHSKVVILHDTRSYQEVYSVCCDLSDNVNVFFNTSLDNYYGLGVLYRL